MRRTIVGSPVILLTALSVLLSVAGAPRSPAAAAEGPAESLRIIHQMIEAHGGMERWVEASTVSFVDTFIPAGAAEGMPSRTVVEQGARRAYIDYVGTDTSLVWDGRRAWSRNWQSSTPPRFLALLNYHFLNLPWLAADPGVNLSPPGTARLWDDPTDYITVKITYDEGAGDTPDDYYVLYIDPVSHRLKACEYIVTYRDLLPEGVEATEPHILVYDNYTAVHGLVVPTHYTIYEKDASVYGSCEIKNWSFSQPFDEARMTMPEDAVLDDSTP